MALRRRLLQCANLKSRSSIAGRVDIAGESGDIPAGTVTCKTLGLGPIAERLEAFIGPYHEPSSTELVFTYDDPGLDAHFLASESGAWSGAFNIKSKDKAVPIEPNALKLRLSIDRASGRFQGMFSPFELAEKPVKFSGVFDQITQKRFGFFADESFSGSAGLAPRSELIDEPNEATVYLR